MVSTSQGLTNEVPISTMTSTPVKKTSARKSLCLFTNSLETKNKTATRRFGSAKSESK